MKVKDLAPNKKNPRKITDERLEMLRKSLVKFGDLSGFVYNQRSKSLVSGHQRQKVVPPNATIKIETKHKKPTSTGTVADGYVLIDGERFKYREVDWDKKTEAEALIAANAHGGEWDADLLKVLSVDVPNINYELAGIPEFKPPKINTPTFEVEQSDEEYIEENPGPDSQLNKENISSAAVFENTEEKKMDVVGRRFVIIIDCDNQEHKDSLKEKLKPLVTEAQARFF